MRLAMPRQSRLRHPTRPRRLPALAAQVAPRIDRPHHYSHRLLVRQQVVPARRPIPYSPCRTQLQANIVVVPSFLS